MTFKKAAALYLELGWPVLPLIRGGKSPLTSRGVYDATCDIGQIDWWDRQHPDANVGIACGVAGLLVVDEDPRANGDETRQELERKYGQLGASVMSLTGGGGLHHVFRLPPGFKHRGQLGPGLEIKASGGYIVAPPSVHASGRFYTWDAGADPRDALPGEAPGWLLKLASAESRADATDGTGDAADTFLGIALRVDGRLGRSLRDGKVAVCCPWLAEHTPDKSGRRTGDGSDSSTALLPPNPPRLGRFVCQHGHCRHRSASDVLPTLSQRAVDAARQEFPDAFKTYLRIVSRKGNS